MNKFNSKTIKTETTPKPVLQSERGHYAPEFLSMLFDTFCSTLIDQVRETFGEASPQMAMLRALDWLHYIAHTDISGEDLEMTHETLMKAINAVTQTGATWSGGGTISASRTEACAIDPAKGSGVG